MLSNAELILEIVESSFEKYLVKYYGLQHLLMSWTLITNIVFFRTTPLSLLINHGEGVTDAIRWT